MTSAAHTDARIDGRFALLDHHGAAVSHRSYGDRLLLIFFGFTHCKAVCPRKLAELSAVLDGLGEAAAAIQPLYITIDPERDTPDRMRSFLAAYPRFVGLTGSRAEIDDVKARFRVFARRVEGAAGGYDVPHTAVTYLIDRDGGYVAHYLDGMPASDMISRIGSAVASRAQES
jgi:protein SCO1